MNDVELSSAPALGDPPAGERSGEEAGISCASGPRKLPVGTEVLLEVVVVTLRRLKLDSDRAC